ncbi:MAG: hypothetical protein V7641_5034 [Blastocatellia bacterium]
MRREKNGKPGRKRKAVTLADTIKATVKISAEIESKNGVHVCLVTLQCGTDEPREFRIGPAYIGKRTGRQWREVQTIWTRAYRYLSEYIGGAMLHTAHQLTDEGSFAAWPDFNADEFCAASGDLRRYDEAAGSRFTAGKPYEDGEYFLYVMGDVAARARNRLRGWEPLNIGSPAVIRYSMDKMKRMIEVHSEYAELWAKARELQIKSERRGETDWRDQAKRHYGKLNKPSLDKFFDLLAEKHEGKTKWTPGDVVIIHAAGGAYMNNRGSWGFGPMIEITTTAQVKALDREMKAFKAREMMTQDKN